MGVPGLFGSWLLGNNRDLDLKDKYLRRYENYDRGIAVNSLALDYNGLIHTFTQEFLGNSPQSDIAQENVRNIVRKGESLQDAIISYIIMKTEELVRKIDPRSYLIIAVDGVPPKAKMEKQRRGRYMTDIHILSKKEKGETIFFNSNVISPGTQFMFDLDLELKKWINTKATDINHGLTVIYSSHMIPGEGEHKIFELFRKGQIKKFTPTGANFKTYDVIYGMDADLILLSLLNAPLIKGADFILFREDAKEKQHLHTINISKLDKFMKDQFAMSPQDFLIVSMLVGNDFLPRMQFMYEARDMNIRREKDDYSGTLGDNLNILLSRFSKFRKEKGIQGNIFVQQNGKVDYVKLAEFFKFIAPAEIIFLEERSKIKYLNPSFFFPQYENKDQFIEDYSNNIDDFCVKKFEYFEENTLVENLEKFLDLYDHDQRDNRKYPLAVLSAEELLERKGEEEENRIIKMRGQYLLMYQWIFDYYLGKEVNLNFSFQYFYSPTIHSLNKFLLDENNISTLSRNILNKINIGPKWTPIQQLFAVLPISSWGLLPTSLSYSLSKNNIMADFFPDPKSIQVIKEGTNENENGLLSILMIPFINETRIFNQVSTVTFTVLEAESFIEPSIHIMQRTNPPSFRLEIGRKREGRVPPTEVSKLSGGLSGQRRKPNESIIRKNPYE